MPVTNCIGSFPRGVRNNSEQHLVDFCAINNLFIGSAAFKHKATHISRWENKRVYPKDLTKTITVYNQIDQYSAARKLSTLSSMPEVSAEQKHRVIIASVLQTASKKI